LWPAKATIVYTKILHSFGIVVYILNLFFSLIHGYYSSASDGACTMHNKKSKSNLGRAASPPLMAENDYATKCPLVTMGCSTITPNCPFHFDDLYLHLIHPPLDRSHSTPQTASRSNQPFCHCTPSGQTD